MSAFTHIPALFILHLIAISAVDVDLSEASFLPVILAPTVGLLLGIGAVATFAGLTHFSRSPVVLPSNAGVIAGVVVLLLPQLGSLHSPFLRLTFTIAMLVHFAIAWEWYLMFQPARTLLIGITLADLEAVLPEVTRAARSRMGAIAQTAPDPTLFDLSIYPHTRIANVVVIQTDPRAFFFVYFLRQELKRILGEHPMTRPSHTWTLLGVGSGFILLGLWLVTLAV